MDVSFLQNSWLSRAQAAQKSTLKTKEGVAQVHWCSSVKDLRALSLSPWQKSTIEKSKDPCLVFSGPQGVEVILRAWPLEKPDFKESAFFKPSDYEVARDLMGRALRELKMSSLKKVVLQFSKDTDHESLLGALVACDLVPYSFKSPEKSTKWPELFVLGVKAVTLNKLLQQAMALAGGVNVARHLVNMPPSHLHPKFYSEWVQALFASCSSIKVDIWDVSRLKKENMNLLLAVGQGAEVPPCHVKVSYRPKGTSQQKPIAIVGKGITFDSGGLDIKPTQAMRFMKKDMGGSAAVVGLAYWAEKTKIKKAIDFYLPMAENAVGANSFRPSDVIVSRLGKSVEIHNTDAEGRLILADALTLANETDPKMIIDVATLTGAVKVGLGSEVGGLFSNDEKLSSRFLMGSQKRGDRFWSMPLAPGYRKKLKSHFADMANASDGYGGAITAALFLEEFVQKTPWLHLDIYAWTDKAQGALNEVGGSGQAVQALAEFLSK